MSAGLTARRGGHIPKTCLVFLFACFCLFFSYIYVKHLILRKVGTPGPRGTLYSSLYVTEGIEANPTRKKSDPFPERLIPACRFFPAPRFSGRIPRDSASFPPLIFLRHYAFLISLYLCHSICTYPRTPTPSPPSNSLDPTGLDPGRRRRVVVCLGHAQVVLRGCGGGRGNVCGVCIGST